MTQSGVIHKLLTRPLQFRQPLRMTSKTTALENPPVTLTTVCSTIKWQFASQMAISTMECAPFIIEVVTSRIWLGSNRNMFAIDTP